MNQRRIWLVSGLALAALFGLRAADPVPTVPATIAPGGLPVGSLVAFAGAAASVPETQGWLLCDGREVEAAIYPELDRVLGSSWGRATAVGRIRLPDLRGRFVRGVNAGAPGEDHDPEAASRRASAPGGDEGDRPGSYQEDAVGPHRHPLMGAGDAIGAGPAGEWVRFFGTKVPDDAAPVVRNLAAIEPGEGVETRPRNVAVHWLIRAR
ncbi:MAG: tail fiber protein [Verrucomicrobiales bacterium]|nr:tail fiber protein [Verrucomicrobiales bacterium]